MTSVNVTSQSNTVTVQQGDATTVTIATQGPQGPAGAGLSDVVNDTSPQLGGDLESNSFDIKFADNDKALFGADSDLQIFHDGSQSVIKDNGTGQLLISGENTIAITSANGTESYARFLKDGAVELFNDNVKRIETTDDGANITGKLHLSDNLDMADDADILLGDNDEFRIFHDESNGLNYIQAHNNGPLILKGSSHILAQFNPSQGTILKYNNSTVFETTTSGAKVTGTLIATGDINIQSSYPNLQFQDSDGNDFRLTNANGNFLLYDITGAATIFSVITNSAFKFHTNVEPNADNSTALGSSSKRFTTLHSAALNTGDINMSNLNDSANEVDGTKGSWTLQEGSDDLFLINRVSGKKYKFNLTEIS